MYAQQGFPEKCQLTWFCLAIVLEMIYFWCLSIDSME